MSAAPVLPQPTQIRSACFTPLSFFERVLDLDNYTQLRCFCLIMAETLGSRPRRPSAEIDTDDFVAACQVSREWVLEALTGLEAAKLIQISTAGHNRRSYAVAPEYIKEVELAGRTKVRGRCPDCKTIALFESQFIPVPHNALRKLGACVDSATFRAVMVVIRHTLHWNPEQRCLESTAEELSLHDFTRVTGLESREILNGLTTAKRLGLIGQEKRKGKPSIFWAIPDALAGLRPREPRSITPRDGEPKETAKPVGAKIVEIPNESAKPIANESAPYFYARCPNCSHFVDVEEVKPEDLAPSEPEKPPRAGPQRETARKKPKFIEDLDRRLQKAIEDAEGVA